MRLVCLVASAAFVFAGERSDPPIVELARSAPPEFFADTILRLVAAGKIPNREQQIELLEDAFTAAAQAKEPIRLTAMPGTPPDTRELYQSKAADLELDDLSLQTRITKAMLKLDAAKSRELFDRIARPKLAPRPCADPLVADISGYYDAAAAIAQNSFTAREKQSELHVEFLNALLVSAQSPNEIAAFVRAIQSVTLSSEQSRYLLASIAAKLELIGADYRPFAMSLDMLQSEMWKLVETNWSSRDEVVRSFRNYVLNQLKAPRCAPDLPLGLDQIFWLQPRVTEDDFSPPERRERFQPHPYFQSDDAKWFVDGLAKLRSQPAQYLADFFRHFDAWRPEGPDVDVFHQRATVLRVLLQTIRGEDRDRILNLAAAFLQSSEIQRQHPADWLWEAREFVTMANPDASKLAVIFRSSANVSLSLYAQLGYFGDSSGTSK